MNIVIPMLGRGSKFIQEGIETPKPLIMVRGKYMFEWALEGLNDFKGEKNLIFLIQKHHADEHGLDKIIRKAAGKKAAIEIVNHIPQGAAKSVLLVKDVIDNDEELVICNADQFFKAQMQSYLDLYKNQIDGLIPIFHATHPRWSYVEADETGTVLRTAEKEAISNKATVGLYYFKHGRDFVAGANEMIKHNLVVAGEYYICPVYNQLIAAGKTIKSLEVDEMWSLGTPEDVYKFEKYYKGDL